MIRPVEIADSQRIADIYNHYVIKTMVSFEEIPVSAAVIQARIENAQTLGLPWLILDVDDEIVGYAYASTWRKRHAYRFTVESTVYLAADQVGQGYGSKLYSALISELKSQGFRTVLGQVSLPNPASVRLHEQFGFKKVAHYSEVGRKFDRWIDVGCWELSLSRVSYDGIED